MTRSQIDIGDTVELVLATALIVAYAYVVITDQYRIEDPLLETLVVVAALAVFGDKARRLFGAHDDPDT